MKYPAWREQVFGQPPKVNPSDVELLLYDLSHDVMLDYVNQALADEEIHARYTREQIGIGLNLIYSNCCSNISFCYTDAMAEAHRVAGIRQMKLLYTNYFDRYCQQPVKSIGNGGKGWTDFLCYMLWDIFIIYPKNSTPSIVSAGLEVMEHGLRMSNDNCIVSAIHGLGHWTLDVPDAAEILRRWMRNPTTWTPEVRSYARQAATGDNL